MSQQNDNGDSLRDRVQSLVKDEKIHAVNEWPVPNTSVRLDVACFNTLGLPVLGIEAKYQEVSGTAYQKIPGTIIDQCGSPGLFECPPTVPFPMLYVVGGAPQFVDRMLRYGNHFKDSIAGMVRESEFRAWLRGNRSHYGLADEPQKTLPFGGS